MTGKTLRRVAFFTSMALLALPAAAQLPATDVPLIASALPAPPPSFADVFTAMANNPNGQLGMAATDLATGETIAFAGHDPFPMASTVKVAIAATYLDGVDRGRFNLDQLYRQGGVMTARQLIDRMLIRSDNRSADILLNAVGGPVAVNAWLAKAGISGQRMDRTIARLVLDDRGRTRPAAITLVGGTPGIPPSLTINDDGEVAPAFSGDARDTSTPRAMVRLLAGLHGGTLLSADSTHYLFDVMARCVTGARRIRGQLPPGTPVAHKTGTLAGVSDDVGIITLANGHPLAVALFVTGMRSEGERDAHIAAAARLLYDRFGAINGLSTGRSVAR